MNRINSRILSILAGLALILGAGCTEHKPVSPPVVAAPGVPLTITAERPRPLEIARLPNDRELTVADPRRDATVQVIEKVLPSVVNIATTELRQVSDPVRRLIMQFNGEQPFEKRLSIGSGVILGEDGYVLTADHVVRRASEIWIKLADGRERRASRIAWASPSDVALLKIETRPEDKFIPIRLAEDDDLLLGETVLSLGNPYGLGGSVSRGILSSKNRRPPSEAEPLGPGDWLQTDAAMNVGSSGGPLVNMRGELIGLNAAIYADAQGIGFAIPIRAVTDSVSGALSPEIGRGLWFGARFKPRRGAEAEHGGVVVTEVETDSPAAQAGLQVGDLVLGVNGRQPRSYAGFGLEMVLSATPDRAELHVQRGGEVKKLSIKLVSLKSVFNAVLIRRRTGATVSEMTLDQARRVGLQRPAGLVVDAVEADSPAAAAKLHDGSIIATTGGVRYDSVVDYARALHAVPAGGTVTVRFVNFRLQGGGILAEDVDAKLKLR